MRQRRLLKALILAPLLTLFLTTEADAWRASAPFRATVNKHVFDKVKVVTDGCDARFTIYFDAPKEMYSDDAPVRNHHRFRARIKLSDGRTVTTNRFYNDKAGKRMYVYRLDTSADGCWAKQEHQLRKVDVNGCRNKKCRIQPFE